MNIKEFAEKYAGRYIKFGSDNSGGILIGYNNDKQEHIWVEDVEDSGYRNSLASYKKNEEYKIISVFDTGKNEDELYVDGFPFYLYQTNNFNSSIKVIHTANEIESLIAALEL